MYLNSQVNGDSLILAIVFILLIWFPLMCNIFFCFFFFFQDDFLKRIGNKHPHYEFLRLLSAKCSYTIFDAEHVQCILSDILSERTVKKNLQSKSIDLLLV